MASTKRTHVVRSAENPVTSYPHNIANGLRLGDQLRLESANSPFTQSGKLQPRAIDEVRIIIGQEKMRNPQIPKGFGKYSTNSFQSPSGSFQVHFYKNSATGEVLYGADYKSVLNAMSGGKKP